MNRSHEYIAEARPTSGHRGADWRSLPRLVISPRWRWFTLATLALAALMIWLGFWQLDRLAQRRAQNALIERRITAPPIAITGAPLDPAANEYRHATVTGTFDHDQTVVLRNRSLNGTPGLHLLTPLRIEGADRAVLVDRGWVPTQLSEPEARRQFDIEGAVQVEGYIRAPFSNTSRLGPQDRVPADGRLDAWFWPDVERIAQQLPYPVLPFYVEAERIAGQTTDLPLPQPQIEQSEGPHLGYALQWFSFTVILLVGYAALVITHSGRAAQREWPAQEDQRV